MAIRIQLRHDTASNWATNNPVLYPGEFGVELDTGKIKVGPEVESPAVGTAWNSISTYINLVPADFDSIINGYLEVTDIGAISGVAGLNNSKNLIVPGESIIIEGSTDNAFETTLAVTNPTADRTITFPDTTGTVALESYVDDAIAAFDALPTQTGNDGKFLQTDGTSTSWAAVDLSTKQDKVTGVSDTEIGYLDGVTSSIQNQLDAKSTASKTETFTNKTLTTPKINEDVALTATATELNTLDGITASTSELNILDGASLTTTELNYVDGVTSAIQDQLDDKFNTADASTTNISEGTHLYFTDERARDAAAALITDSTHTGISVSYTDDGSAEGSLEFTNTGVTSLTGTANEVVVSGSTGEVTIGLPDNVTIGNDLVVYGNLNVQGTTTTTYSATVSTHDNVLYLNAAVDTTITNAVGDGTYVTYTADNAYTPGMDIRVTGMDPSGYNISSADGLTVYSATSTQFVVAKTTTGSFVSGGTGHAKSEVNADLGFAGGYYDGGYAHAGLFRDSSDGKFKVFQGYTLEPDESVNIDTTHGSFALAPIAASSIEVTSATIGDVSNTEIGYLNGVTSAIQDQLDDKQAILIPGTGLDVSGANISIDNAELSNYLLEGVSGSSYGLIGTSTYLDIKNTNGYNKEIELDIAAVESQLNTDGYLTTSSTSTLTNKTLTSPKINEDVALTATATELNYVDGVTSAIQTQLDAKVDESIITAKGDLYVGSASATLDNLAVGSNGYLLTADSAEPLGVKWAAAPVSLPDQTGNNGEYLTTDGTTASWAAIPVTPAATRLVAGSVLGVTNSSYVTALGANALGAFNTADATAIGMEALRSNTSGIHNVALGNETLYQNTTGEFNTALGSQALRDKLNTASNNTAVGYSALYNTTGSFNTAIGALAGNNATSGNNNILIGASAQKSSITASNEITLGNSSITRFRIPGIGLDIGNSSTLSSNTISTIDTTALEAFTSIEYMVSLKQGTKIRTSKVIVQNNGSSVDMTEFAITETGGVISGVVVSAAVSSTNAVLQLTVTDAASTNVTVKLSKVAL